MTDKYHRKKSKIKPILIVLSVLAVAGITYAVIANSSHDSSISENMPERTRTSEVTLDKIYLNSPSSLDERRIRMWQEDDREKGFIGVRMFPNDKTIPNQIYTVNLFYKDKLVDKGIVFWEPNALLPSEITGKVYYEDKAKILSFPVPKDHELYQTYFSQIYKPVSERHFNINEYVKVIIVKGKAND